MELGLRLVLLSSAAWVSRKGGVVDSGRACEASESKVSLWYFCLCRRGKVGNPHLFRLLLPHLWSLDALLLPLIVLGLSSGQDLARACFSSVRTS